MSGGAGVIGRELVRLLKNQGAHILVGDLQPEPVEFRGHVKYWQGDLNQAPKQLYLDFEPEYFFHLAATFERSTESLDFWQENDWHNVRLSHQLLETLSQVQKLKKYIFASSYLIYDKKQYQFTHPQKTPKTLNEEDLIRPRNICGAAKLFHECELEFFNQFNFPFQSVCARIYRSYGLGSRDIISRWIRQLIQEKPLELFKTENSFDYVYARDVAQGLLHLAQSEATGVVNLGRGRSRKIQDIVRILKDHFPKMKTVEVDKNMDFEVSQADLSLLKDLTNWQPCTDLEKAIPEIIEYEKHHQALGEYQYQSSIGESFNVLITSVSQKVPLVREVRRAFDKLGLQGQIIGADTNPHCLASHFVDDLWIMPPLKTMSEEVFIRELLNRKISLVIPTRDGELPKMAKWKTALEESGIQIMLSSQKTVEICFDKYKFYQQGLEKNWPVIPTYLSLPDSSQDSKWVVKERRGAGSENMGIGLNPEETVSLAHQLKDPIFQEYIQGDEFSIDLYCHKEGEVKAILPRQRNIVIHGESKVTTLIRDSAMENLGQKLAKDLNLLGHAVLQVIKEKKGSLKIIECNPRFGGASSLSIYGGVDTFYWEFLRALKQDVSGSPIYYSKKPLTQIRYSQDLIIQRDHV